MPRQVSPLSPKNLRGNNLDKALDKLRRSSVGDSNVGAFNKRGSSRRKDPIDRSIDLQHRIVVIGDLHGMISKLKKLWREVESLLGAEALLSALVVFLGDYCDRGKHTKEVISWLVALKRERDCVGARTVFLLGNHEFCLLGFLGMLPRPECEPNFLFRWTWDDPNGILSQCEKERWWNASENLKDGAVDEVHLQGRRWGGSWYERSYGSRATFTSYDAPFGDKNGLKRAMPEEHLAFLMQCPWVHVEENPLVGRCVFVHAGLEADGSEDCEAQLMRLKHRDSRHPQPEALFGRERVLHTPPQLAQCGTTVISGHHGRVVFRSHRVILDPCSGDNRFPLNALVLPEMLLVHHDGALQANDPVLVFGLPAEHQSDQGPGRDEEPSQAS